jgi:hypothetical protein
VAAVTQPRPSLPCSAKMNEDRDLNDGKPWSEMDIEDLRHAVENNWTIEDTARFLCRITAVDEVEAKAKELGLPVRHE